MVIKLKGHFVNISMPVFTGCVEGPSEITMGFQSEVRKPAVASFEDRNEVEKITSSASLQFHSFERA